MKTRFVALAVATALGFGSVSAFAQDHHRDGRGAGAWQHQRGDYNRGDWNHRYSAPRYYQPSHGYRRDSGDVAGALVLGALAGVALGQVANGYNYQYNPAPAYYAPPTNYYAPPATYYNPGYGYYYGP